MSDFTRIQGSESLFFIKRTTDDTFVPVACLTSSPFTEETDFIPTTTRDNEGWETSLPTMQRYSLEVNGVMILDDADSGNNAISYMELRRIKRNREKIEWMIKTLGGWYVDSGQAYISAISKSDEVGSEVSFSASLVGCGAPEESNGRIYVLGNENTLYVHGTDNNILIPTE